MVCISIEIGIMCIEWSVLKSPHLLKSKVLESIISVFWKIRAVAPENCRVLRLISAIKLIFKNRMTELLEIYGTSEIKEHCFFKRKSSISNLPQCFQHMKIMDARGRKVYVNYKDLTKPMTKFIKRLYEVIPWCRVYLQCLEIVRTMKGHVHSPLLNCGKL